jgi:hypothetical protein
MTSQLGENFTLLPSQLLQIGLNSPQAIRHMQGVVRMPPQRLPTEIPPEFQEILKVLNLLLQRK